MVVDALVLNMWLCALHTRNPRYAGGRPPLSVKPFCLGMPIPAMEYLHLNGHRIAYWTIGSGVPIVLVHGSFATSSAWKRLVANLDTSTWRAIALDLPGCGESDPPPDNHPTLVEYDARAVEAVAKHAGSEAYHLAGHSYGGVVALAVALGGRVPVMSLVLYEPLPLIMLAHSGDREASDELASFVATYRRAFEAGEQWAARGVIELWGGAGAFEAMSPTMRDFIAAGTERNLRHWEGNFAFKPTLDELREIQAQTALVHGTSAHWIAKLLVKRLKDTLPRSTVFEIPGASHFMLHTHASESARIISDTIRTSPLPQR